MDVDDASNTQNKLDRQWTLLEESDIDGSDRKSIHDFVRMERQGNQDMARNTLYRDLSSLRNASDRALVKAGKLDSADLAELEDTNEEFPGVYAGGAVESTRDEDTDS